MKELFELIGSIGDFLGFFGSVAAIAAWVHLVLMKNERTREEARRNQKVKIKLHLTDGDRTIVLPIPIRRHEITRAEMLGRLGMVQMKEGGKRFSLSHIGTPQFLEDLEEIFTGTKTELVIPASEAEIDQFKV